MNDSVLSPLSMFPPAANAASVERWSSLSASAVLAIAEQYAAATLPVSHVNARVFNAVYHLLEHYPGFSPLFPSKDEPSVPHPRDWPTLVDSFAYPFKKDGE